jgi:hypothetical protein
MERRVTVVEEWAVARGKEGVVVSLGDGGAQCQVRVLR